MDRSLCFSLCSLALPGIRSRAITFTQCLRRLRRPECVYVCLFVCTHGEKKVKPASSILEVDDIVYHGIDMTVGAEPFEVQLEPPREHPIPPWGWADALNKPS